ncbi:PREDICTED: hepatitis A virus cellular receptor 1 [Chinchilla lanigera]|uniref:hepatitis A virus cellular receptor 1 n=1 Tax=Chinchilla lanigera TaxID=34839 RepID=UPI000695A428|nr:PREDICTED: hepatitis A virus cellular receptor 1 [Chinchilla lanigera]
MILQPQVFALGLLLLQTGVVFSTQVNAVLGQSVTLPCTYSVSRGAHYMCWGRGPCPPSKCSRTLVNTNGYQVTYQKDRRYQLSGKISQGDVSLTIQNVNTRDSGQYCCRIEVPGWFNDIKKTISLQVMPAPATTTEVPTTPRVSTAPPTPAQTQTTETAPATTTEVPTTPRVSTAPPTPAQTQTSETAMTTRLLTTPQVSTAPPISVDTWSPKTAPAEPTSVPTSARSSASAPPAPAHTQSNETEPSPPVPTQAVETQPTTLQETETQLFTSPESSQEDGNGTVTQSSGGPRQNDQPEFPAQHKRVDAKRLYVGILVSSLLLLISLVVIIVKKRFIGKRRTLTLSKVLWMRPRNQALEQQSPAEDEVYIIKNNVFVLD